MSTMGYLRSYYGVPAKRGGLVKPKVGPHSGQIGRIKRVSGSYLRVRDNGAGRLMAWEGLYHPTDLEYVTPAAHDPAMRAAIITVLQAENDHAVATWRIARRIDSKPTTCSVRNELKRMEQAGFVCRHHWSTDNNIVWQLVEPEAQS